MPCKNGDAPGRQKALRGPSASWWPRSTRNVRGEYADLGLDDFWPEGGRGRASFYPSRLLPHSNTLTGAIGMHAVILRAMQPRLRGNSLPFGLDPGVRCCSSFLPLPLLHLLLRSPSLGHMLCRGFPALLPQAICSFSATRWSSKVAMPTPAHATGPQRGLQVRGGCSRLPLLAYRPESN